MKKDKGLYERFIRLDYHILGPLDEQLLDKINTFGSQSFMLLNTSILISIILTGLTGQKQWQIIPVIAFIVVQSRKREFIKKLGALYLEITKDELSKAQRDMTKRAFFLAVSQFIFLFAIGLYLLGFNASSSHYPNRSSLHIIGLLALFCFLFTIFLFLNQRHKYLSRIVILDDTNNNS